jgi:hypothetical protein
MAQEYRHLILWGLMTLSGSNRNFNFVYKDKNGKHFSYSLISRYKLTDSEYSETVIYSLLNDENGGTGLDYQMEKKSTSVPVNISDGKIEFKMPFDPVTITFYENRFTAEETNSPIIGKRLKIRDK